MDRRTDVPNRKFTTRAELQITPHLLLLCPVPPSALPCTSSPTPSLSPHLSSTLHLLLHSSFFIHHYRSPGALLPNSSGFTYKTLQLNHVCSEHNLTHPLNVLSLSLSQSNFIYSFELLLKWSKGPQESSPSLLSYLSYLSATNIDWPQNQQGM